MSILSILESVKWGIYIGSLKLILDYVREMFISHFIQPNFAYDMEKQRNILNAVGCYGQPTSFIPQCSHFSMNFPRKNPHSSNFMDGISNK